MIGLGSGGTGEAAHATRSGLVQRIDPRIRIILGIIFALVTVSLADVVPLLLALLLALSLAALARLSMRSTLRRMLALEAFMIPVLLFLPFTVPGEPIAAAGSLSISAEGLARAAGLLLAVNAVVLATQALIGTIGPAALGHALLALRVPEKLARLVSLTVRYISVVQSEYDRLRLAMTARGFQPRGNLHTWRSLGYLFGMLLVRSFARSERIMEAMACRGFGGRYVVLTSSAPVAGDWVFAGCVGVALVALGGCAAVL
jgi:cobalt/nickel transport system permease protein